MFTVFSGQKPIVPVLTCSVRWLPIKVGLDIFYRKSVAMETATAAISRVGKSFFCLWHGMIAKSKVHMQLPLQSPLPTSASPPCLLPSSSPSGRQVQVTNLLIHFEYPNFFPFLAAAHLGRHFFQTNFIGNKPATEREHYSTLRSNFGSNFLSGNFFFCVHSSPKILCGIAGIGWHLPKKFSINESNSITI
jgi:hypothetical protein